MWRDDGAEEKAHSRTARKAFLAARDASKLVKGESWTSCMTAREKQYKASEPEAALAPKPEPAPKKRRREQGDSEAVAQQSLRNYITYNKKSKDGFTKDTVQALEEQYKKVKGDHQMAAKFALRFMETKKTKDFSWVKNFKETYRADKDEKTSMNEAYMTRTCLWTNHGNRKYF